MEWQYLYVNLLGFGLRSVRRMRDPFYTTKLREKQSNYALCGLSRLPSVLCVGRCPSGRTLLLLLLLQFLTVSDPWLGLRPCFGVLTRETCEFRCEKCFRPSYGFEIGSLMIISTYDGYSDRKMRSVLRRKTPPRPRVIAFTVRVDITKQWPLLLAFQRIHL